MENMQKALEKISKILYNKGKLLLKKVKMNFLKWKYSKIGNCLEDFRGKYEKIF